MSRSLSRRRLFQGAAGLITAIGISPKATADTVVAFDALRTRWASMQTGNGFHDGANPVIRQYIAGQDADARQWRASMTASPPKDEAVWNDAAAGTEVVNTRTSFDRLRLLAIAFATPSSVWANDPALLKDIASALMFLAANRYNLAIAKTGNWWEWEIGVPLALLDIVIVLGDHLDAGLVDELMAAIDRFTPAPAMTAANLVWTSHIVLLRALVGKNADKFQQAITAIETTLPDVQSGDGFHSDGSFVQHDAYAYTGGYGLSLLQRTTDLLYLLHGSAYSPPIAIWEPLRRRVYTAFEPLMDRGGLMDMILGRGISRSYGQGHMVGRLVTTTVARLAVISPQSDATAFKSMVKYWVSADSTGSIFDYDTRLKLPLHSICLVQAIMDGSIAARGTIAGNYQFPAMDRIVHKRANFTFAIAQSSRFISNYESINAENLHGWYTGSGMTYLYNADAGHYQNDFWPTADMHRLPGTTVDNRPLTDGEYAGTRGQDIVGGVTLGKDGMACMAFAEYGGELTGKKAWFMFGERILCLGTDITSTSKHAVETIIENRNVGASDAPYPAVISEKTWSHIAGTGGYIFHEGAAKSLNEQRTGTWMGINNRPSSPTDPRTRKYVTLWLDHGIGAQATRYAYTLLPNATPSETEAYAGAPAMQILANTPIVQHVRHASAQAVVFWQSGESEALSCDAPACVMLRTTGEHLEIALADPTEVRTQAVSVILKLPRAAPVSADASIAVTCTPETVILHFDPTGTHGQTRQARLRLENSHL